LELDVKEARININDDDYDIYWAIGDYLGDANPGLKRRFLWSSPYGIFASPDYLRNNPKIVSVDDLKQHQIIAYLYNDPSNLIVTQCPKDEEGFAYHSLTSRVKTVTGLLELARDGLGLINANSDAPDIRKSLAKGELTPVLQEHWWQKAKVHVYFHDSKPLSPKVRAFLDFFIAKVALWGKEMETN
jgi:DNA-binding transcriptional LysR family regulator